MQTTLLLACLSITLAVFAIPGCTTNHDSAASYPDITVDSAADLIAADANVVVLDIRTPAEYEAGHIPGAVLLDCKAANFGDELRKLDPSKTYVMH